MEASTGRNAFNLAGGANDPDLSDALAILGLGDDANRLNAEFFITDLVHAYGTAQMGKAFEYFGDPVNKSNGSMRYPVL